MPVYVSGVLLIVTFVKSVSTAKGMAGVIVLEVIIILLLTIQKQILFE